MSNEEVRLVNDSTALLSMRESDFDAYSAMGEVIDNSIQAEAQSVKVRFDTAPSGKKGGYTVVRSVAFGDDGYGMPADVLHRCMQLGYSSRYNDRSGIGRFGVGMTLAAINQCKRVDVYSKEKQGQWLHTFMDIDEFCSQPPKMTSIPNPVNEAPPREFADLVGQGHGTLVVWSKYDRQPESADRMVDRLRVWIGGTYRKFLWNHLTIFVDGQEVDVIDPLYLDSRKTRFPDDPAGEAFEPITLDWPVTKENGEDLPEMSTIIIRMSLIHESLRPAMGTGRSKEAQARHIPDNEGISILRNGRQVAYGPIPYWPGKPGKAGSPWFSEIDRWWGCEISFDAVLDKSFMVKNIKRGAVPEPDLKKAILDLIAPTRNTCLERVRAVWEREKTERRRIEEKRENGIQTGHEEAERIAKKTPTDKSAIDRTKNVDEEATKLVEDLRKDASEKDKALWVARFKDNPFTIVEDSWNGPSFVEAIHMGGKDVIKYNRQHLFWEEVHAILGVIEEEVSDTDSDALRLKSLIDLLLISYSKAEAKFEAGMMFSAEDFVDNLRLNWGQYLKSYLYTWRSDNE